MNRPRTARFALAVTASIALIAGASCAVWQPPAVAKPLSEPRSYRAPFAPALAGVAGATGASGDGRGMSRVALGGSLESGAWAAAPWTEDFTDIEGSVKPAPAYRTRVKMLWDESFLYVGAELMEPDIWSTLAVHDEIVFHDNDFEVFIDPNGDGREYYEIEINARGTVFDLFLHRPYREGAPAIHEWDVTGAFAKSVSFKGTPDDPRDVDQSWTVMMAIPWKAFVPPTDTRIAGLPADQQAFGERARAAAAPKPGETWRINFSRVQWRHNHEALDAAGVRLATPNAAARSAPGGAEPYAKRAGLPEDNWVWSPQWAIDMHLPQFWGRVTFVR